MGFMDKLKGLFKKKNKDKAADASKKSKAAAKSVATFSGEGKVADALRYAASKIDAKLAAGAFDEKRAEAFVGMLKAVEASADPEDSKLIQISQIIGGIINA